MGFGGSRRRPSFRPVCRVKFDSKSAFFWHCLQNRWADPDLTRKFGSKLGAFRNYYMLKLDFFALFEAKYCVFCRKFPKKCSRSTLPGRAPPPMLFCTKQGGERLIRYCLDTVEPPWPGGGRGGRAWKVPKTGLLHGISKEKVTFFDFFEVFEPMEARNIPLWTSKA